MALRQRFRNNEAGGNTEDDKALLVKNPMIPGATSSFAPLQSQLSYPLSPAEQWWASHQPYLKSRGYILCPS
jgi:hypothetical protein